MTTQGSKPAPPPRRNGNGVGNGITGNTRVSLGLLLGVIAMTVGIVAQWVDVASRFRTLESTLELRLKLVQQDVELRTADMLQRFSRENGLRMVPHAGYNTPKEQGRSQ